MQAQTQVREIGTDGPRGLHLALMTCGTVAAVALVGAALAWSPSRDGEARGGGAMGSNIASEQVDNPAAAHAVASAGQMEHPATTAPAPMLVYVVATPEQAEVVRRMAAELNEIRSQLGQRRVETAVVLAGERTVEVFAHLPGAPGTRFIDLRTS
jgi:hypothetical protein